MKAAVVSFCQHSDSAHRAIVDALRSDGFQVEGSAGDTDQPCIVILDQVDENIRARVQTLARFGLRRVLCLSAGPSLQEEDYWGLLAARATDVVQWTGDEPTRRTIKERIERWIEIDEIVDSPVIQTGLIGRSTAWLSTLRQVVEIGRFTCDSVLVTGESGTGKELVARLIHSLDPKRKDGRLVLLDCTTIVPELSGSEFFGHERGAFTSAMSTREGAFELADGGTLFLDEIGELPLRLQAELLRVIQEGTYKRVGSNAWKRTDFRLVCATNRSLEQECLQGRFRTDLYYRLATWTVHLPTLQQRGAEDILLLARHFLEEFCPGPDIPRLHPVVKRFLLSRAYPGNVRDLRRLVQRIVHCHVGPGAITVGSIPPDERGADEEPATTGTDSSLASAVRTFVLQGKGLREICDVVREVAYDVAIQQENGHTIRAAERLNVSPRAVQVYKSRQGA